MNTDSFNIEAVEQGKRNLKIGEDMDQNRIVGNLIKAGIAIWGINEVCKRMPPDIMDRLVDSMDRSPLKSGGTLDAPTVNFVNTQQHQVSDDNHFALIGKPFVTLSDHPMHEIQVPFEPQQTPSIIQLPLDHNLTEIIPHPSVALILGKRGSGKTAQGYRLLEISRYRATPYVVALPKAAQKLLPEWIGFAEDLEEVPHDSIVLIDEAYISYHSRGSVNARSKAMSQIINLSRQRNQTLVFVSQEARQIDRNIASSANVVIFKELGMLQLEFDRSELNKLARHAKTQFDGINGDKRGWSYIYSPEVDFLGLMQNALPSFWKPSLSRIFATENPDPSKRYPKRLTKEERIEKAKELFGSGLSYDQIGKILNVTKGTAYNYINGYPYRA